MKTILTNQSASAWPYVHCLSAWHGTLLKVFSLSSYLEQPAFCLSVCYVLHVQDTSSSHNWSGFSINKILNILLVFPIRSPWALLGAAFLVWSAVWILRHSWALLMISTWLQGLTIWISLCLIGLSSGRWSWGGQRTTVTAVPSAGARCLSNELGHLHPD